MNKFWTIIWEYKIPPPEGVTVRLSKFTKFTTRLEALDEAAILADEQPFKIFYVVESKEMVVATAEPVVVTELK